MTTFVPALILLFILCTSTLGDHHNEHELLARLQRYRSQQIRERLLQMDTDLLAQVYYRRYLQRLKQKRASNLYPGVVKHYGVHPMGFKYFVGYQRPSGNRYLPPPQRRPRPFYGPPPTDMHQIDTPSVGPPQPIPIPTPIQPDASQEPKHSVQIPVQPDRPIQVDGSFSSGGTTIFLRPTQDNPPPPPPQPTQPLPPVHVHPVQVNPVVTETHLHPQFHSVVTNNVHPFITTNLTPVIPHHVHPIVPAVPNHVHPVLQPVPNHVHPVLQPVPNHVHPVLQPVPNHVHPVLQSVPNHVHPIIPAVPNHVHPVVTPNNAQPIPPNHIHPVAVPHHINPQIPVYSIIPNVQPVGVPTVSGPLPIYPNQFLRPFIPAEPPVLRVPSITLNPVNPVLRPVQPVIPKTFVPLQPKEVVVPIQPGVQLRPGNSFETSFSATFPKTPFIQNIPQGVVPLPGAQPLIPGPLIPNQYPIQFVPQFPSLFRPATGLVPNVPNGHIPSSPHPPPVALEPPFINSPQLTEKK